MKGRIAGLLVAVMILMLGATSVFADSTLLTKACTCTNCTCTDCTDTNCTCTDCTCTNASQGDKGTPGEGTGTPGEGTGTPGEGTGTPGEGTGTPGEGTGTPGEGNHGQGTPGEGNHGQGTPGQALPSATSTEAVAEMATNMIQAADQGGTVAFAVDGEATVAQDIFKAAKEKGVALTIASGDGSISFSFQDLNSIDKMSSGFTAKGTIGTPVKAIDDKLASSLSKDTTAVDIDFTFSGTLPGTAKVTLALPEGKFTEGATVYFYYYNPTTGLFEKVDSAKVTDGKIAVSMSHCSQYVVVDKELDPSIVKSTATPAATTPAATSPKTGDATSTLALILALLAGFTACGYGLFKKTRA